ncbi:hypothetical protein CcCBS67573_g00293 [Chytriomyces confervae]|uniref:CLASP N-terminal domain-containing protein n=1 Tax=Chytriomyces confervae TaxID=246404 RepID=A0A507FQA4_9FUNG|nr:suppressor of tub2 mutation [Chytriomyces hyalinus]TPX78443.1 hypothetical protein CcCBS67573_g00293 [Chytriomyces confervae]
MEAFTAAFHGKESEQNWESRDRALKALGEDAHLIETIAATGAPALRSVMEHVLGATASLRTTLVITACATCANICASLTPAQLDPLIDLMLKNLLKLAGNAKKLVASAGASAIFALISQCTFHVRTLQTLANLVGDKNASVRSYCVAYIKAVVEPMLADDHARSVLEKTGGLDIVEKCLKKSLSDATSAVREISRLVFDMLRAYWPARCDSLLNALDASTKKAILKKPSSFKLPKSNLIGSGELSGVSAHIARAGSAEYALDKPSKPPTFTDDPQESVVSTPCASPRPDSVDAETESNHSTTTSLADEVERIVQLLRSGDASQLKEGILSLSQDLLERCTQCQLEQLQMAISDCSSDPQIRIRQSLIENICNAHNAADLIQYNLVTDEEMARLALCALTAEVVVPNFSPSPFLQQLLSKHLTTQIFPTQALQLLVQCLTVSSTSSGTLGQRFSRPKGAPPSANNGSQLTALFMRTLLELKSNPAACEPIKEYLSSDTLFVRAAMNPLTRILSMRSTVQSARESAFELLRFLYECNEPAFRKFLETLDFDLAEEIQLRVGVSVSEGQEEDVHLNETSMEVESGGVSTTGTTSDPISSLDMQTGTGLISGENMNDLATSLLSTSSDLHNASEMGSSRDMCDDISDGPSNLADVTFGSGLVDESLFDEQSGDLDRSEDVDEMESLLQPIESLNLGTPKQQQRYFSATDKTMGTSDTFSGGLVGLPSEHMAMGFDDPPATVKQQKIQMLEQYDSQMSELSRKFMCGDYSPEVLSGLYKLVGKLAAAGDGQSGDEESVLKLFKAILRVISSPDMSRESRESLFLILAEMFMMVKVQDSIQDLDIVAMLLSNRSDGNFEVAAAADVALNSFVENAGQYFCFQGLMRVLQERRFDLWILDPHADDYQPHPTSSTYFYLGKLIRERIGEQIGEERWEVERVMGICAKDMGSPHVEVRRSATMCLVDISKAWTLQEEGFWTKIGGLLTPPQLHLLSTYVSQ